MPINNSYLENITETCEYIKSKINIEPEIGLILGSGLGDLAEEIENPIKLLYKDIPNFPVSTVKGHKGVMVVGTFCGKNVLCLQGRFHYYEGNSMKTIAYPIRVMKKLGIKKLILTNAAGGVNEKFSPADLMLINDHINFMGNNPLIGENYDEIGERFPDMSQAYDLEMRKLAINSAKVNKIDLKQGVYMAMTGPCYETPAEIRMARALGADAVGMSTVPETIAANHCGIKVLGLSCITNMAAGITQTSLSHSEVIATTKKARMNFEVLVKDIVNKL